MSEPIRKAKEAQQAIEDDVEVFALSDDSDNVSQAGSDSGDKGGMTTLGSQGYRAAISK